MGGQRPRPTSDTAALMNLAQGRHGPVSAGDPSAPGWYASTEARAIDRWFEDLSNYEKTLEQMSELKLLDSFKEELRVIDAWCGCRTLASNGKALASRPVPHAHAGPAAAPFAHVAPSRQNPAGSSHRTRASGRRSCTRCCGTARRSKCASSLPCSTRWPKACVFRARLACASERRLIACMHARRDCGGAPGNTTQMTTGPDCVHSVAAVHPRLATHLGGGGAGWPCRDALGPGRPRPARDGGVASAAAKAAGPS